MPTPSPTALVINFNTAALTQRCVQSIIESGVRHILVLDNASEQDDYQSLSEALSKLNCILSLIPPITAPIPGEEWQQATPPSPTKPSFSPLTISQRQPEILPPSPHCEGRGEGTTLTPIEKQASPNALSADLDVTSYVGIEKSVHSALHNRKPEQCSLTDSTHQNPLQDSPQPVPDSLTATGFVQRPASGTEPSPPALTLIRSHTNLGFAAGSNLQIAHAFQRTNCTHVLLINSDAILTPNGASELINTAISNNADLVGGRVNLMRLHPDGSVELTDTVESLGIALYKSLLASNRKHEEERFLGPTGGCALLSRHVLENLQRAHGYIFDPDYFCYAEDTDLCIRAVLLGYNTEYTSKVIAYHQGQGSSGGAYSEFVYYHGIRNSIWTLLKSIPGILLIRYFPWILLLHIGIILQHTLRGQFRLTLSIYIHAAISLPRLLRKRTFITNSHTFRSMQQLRARITPWFYEPEYLRNAIKQLTMRN